MVFNRSAADESLPTVRQKNCAAMLQVDNTAPAAPPPADSSDRPVHVPLDRRWAEVVRTVDVALQPVVSIHTGRCAGYEAFLRGFEALGHPTIAGFFDAAFADDVLPEVEACLFERAIAAFIGLKGADDLKLFLNIDGRTLLQIERLVPWLRRFVDDAGLPEAALVMEVSERQPVHASENALRGLQALRAVAGRIALDDFGTGYSGLPLLYFAQPDYIKINRFFIGDTARDGRKKVFLRHVVNVAHLLGIQVVAEGVETEKEYYTVKDVGCDLVQGFLIQHPSADPGQMALDGQVVQHLNDNDRRAARSDQRLVSEQIDHIVPIRDDGDLQDVFDRFRTEQTSTFFPVVDRQGMPMGIVREQDLKAYAYSPFGKELLSNRGYGRQLKDFLWKCPVADINTKAEKILEIFSADENSEGILIVEDGRYVGFLSARSLLRILNEKNLALARDMNPLTKLPGNNMINGYLGEAMTDLESAYTIAYIDFDNFKPFNDKYGFRQGDRAIMLFAEILNKDLPRENVFVGHVGGDDFFAGFRNFDFEDSQKLTAHVIERFRAEVESFYDEEARAAGFITAKDREGVERRMPLLSASAALVQVPRGHAPGSIDEISAVIAQMKKEAKRSPTKLAAVSVR